MNRFPEVTFSVAQADFACNEIEPGKASKDPIEVEIDPIRSTWFQKENSGHPTMQVDPKRLFGFYARIPFLELGDRVEYETRFRQYRTYKETIVLKNVGIEPDFIYAGNDHSKKMYFDAPGRILLEKIHTFTTPSGLKLTIGQPDARVYNPTHELSVRIWCSQGVKNLTLADSPLYRDTGKPFALNAGIIVNGVLKTAGGWGEGKDRGKGTEYIDVYLPYPGKLPTKPTVIPELKLVIIQKAILEEKQVTVRFPIEAEVPQTKKTK
jgi:hypothetical protein